MAIRTSFRWLLNSKYSLHRIEWRALFAPFFVRDHLWTVLACPKIKKNLFYKRYEYLLIFVCKFKLFMPPFFFHGPFLARFSTFFSCKKGSSSWGPEQENLFFADSFQDRRKIWAEKHLFRIRRSDKTILFLKLSLYSDSTVVGFDCRLQ